MDAPPPIIVVEDRIERAELERLVSEFFGDMVKFVVDLEARIVAAGGELHADAEELLLARGSRQADLWGGNYYPGRGKAACIEYTSFINIRPSQGNRAMEVQDPELRERIRELVFERLGTGEEDGWPASTPT